MQRPYQNAKLSLPHHQWRGFYLVALVKGPVNYMTAKQNGVGGMSQVVVVDIQIDTDIAFY